MKLKKVLQRIAKKFNIEHISELTSDMLETEVMYRDEIYDQYLPVENIKLESVYVSDNKCLIIS